MGCTTINVPVTNQSLNNLKAALYDFNHQGHSEALDSEPSVESVVGKIVEAALDKKDLLHELKVLLFKEDKTKTQDGPNLNDSRPSSQLDIYDALNRQEPEPVAVKHRLRVNRKSYTDKVGTKIFLRLMEGCIKFARKKGVLQEFVDTVNERIQSGNKTKRRLMAFMPAQLYFDREWEEGKTYPYYKITREIYVHHHSKRGYSIAMLERFSKIMVEVLQELCKEDVPEIEFRYIY